jgi:hypothetical protein
VLVVVVVVDEVVAGALSTAALLAHPDGSTTANAANTSLGTDIKLGFLEVVHAHLTRARCASRG